MASKRETELSLFDLSGVCIHVPMCVHTCVGQKLTGYLSQLLSISFIETGLSLNLDFTDLAKPVGQGVLGSTCLCRPSAGIISTHHYAWLFTQVPGI